MKQSVNVVCLNEKRKYLLQMRDGTPGICNPLQWNFGGGKIEGRETPLTAAMREFEEEVGISGPQKDFVLLGDMAYDGGVVHFFKYVPVVGWNNLDVREGAGAGFFTKEEIFKIHSTEQTKLLAQRFL